MEEKQEHEKVEIKYNTPNDLNLKVVGLEDQELLNEKCCTCINVILQNNGNIQTSFLGAHNPEIVRNLEKAMKLYFKGLKKALKQHFIEDECCDDECCCGEHGQDCCHDKQDKEKSKKAESCEKDKKEANNKKSKSKWYFCFFCMLIFKM